MKNAVLAIALSLVSATSFATIYAPGQSPWDKPVSAPETANDGEQTVCGAMHRSPVGPLLLSNYLLVANDDAVAVEIRNLREYDLVCATSSVEPGFGIEFQILYVDSIEKKGNIAAQ